MEKKTLGEWAFELKVRLLDTKYYEDEKLYTFEEYGQIVPRNVEVPLVVCEEELKPSIININGVLSLEVQTKIVEFERQAKAIKEAQDKLKEAILKEMEEKQIIKLESDDLLITYVGTTYRESLDSKQLKADDEALYNKYIKISPVKSSIRIKVK